MGGLGRLNRVPTIRIDLDEDAYTALYTDESLDDPRTLIAADLLADVDSTLAAEGFPPARVERVDVGRGASATGLAIEVLDVIDKVGGVGGAIVALRVWVGRASDVCADPGG